MQTRIKTLVTSHKDLTNAVSHELKTPLARLRFAISLLAESKSDSERNQLLEKMQHDVDELNQLVQEMLLYSRLERDVPRIQLESTPVSTWLNTAIADETDAAAAEGISLPVNIEGSATAVPCEPRYMARAVRNLVRNALRHAHSSIRVSIAYHDTNCTIHVDDDGAGIPTEQRERLFIPFTRIDESRSRLTESASSSSGGSGLGLAIVKRIAEWHGGNATITDSPLGGARVSIQWPSALGTAS
jgi:two-component system, OmpR family, sensor kinase ParS